MELLRGLGKHATRTAVVAEGVSYRCELLYVHMPANGNLTTMQT